MTEAVNISEPDIVERMRRGDERVHIAIGAVCNNNCIFCMEEDREGRREVNSRTDDSLVRWILEQNPGAEEICFTSGEPTTNPALPLANWTVLGVAPEFAPGLYLFFDAGDGSSSARFYCVRSP